MRLLLPRVSCSPVGSNRLRACGLCLCMCVWVDSGLRRLQSWLEVLGAGQYFDRFVQAGYDFDFTAQVRFSLLFI